MINNRWIVTAAHCVAARAPFTTFVVTGSVFRKSGGTMNPILRSIVHQHYSSLTWNNDLALLQTRDVVIFTAIVQPVNLAVATVGANVNLIVSGWGETSTVSNVMKF